MAIHGILIFTCGLLGSCLTGNTDKLANASQMPCAASKQCASVNGADGEKDRAKRSQLSGSRIAASAMMKMVFVLIVYSMRLVDCVVHCP